MFQPKSLFGFKSHIGKKPTKFLFSVEGIYPILSYFYLRNDIVVASVHICGSTQVKNHLGVCFERGGKMAVSQDYKVSNQMC